MTTPSWLSRSLRYFFVQFFWVFLGLFSVLYCAHLWMKCSFDISNFLKEISCLSPSVVFLYFFALFIEEGLLIFLAILWNSAYSWVCLSLSPLLFASLLSSTICKASSDNHSAFLHFFFFGMILVSVQIMSLCP